MGILSPAGKWGSLYSYFDHIVIFIFYFSNILIYLLCSGNSHDNMVVLKQESRFAKANDCSFFHVRLHCWGSVMLTPLANRISKHSFFIKLTMNFLLNCSVICK